MQFAVNDHQIFSLEKQLVVAKGMARLALLCSLAWYVRQRNSKQSIKFADEASALIATLAASSDQINEAKGRLELVRGEYDYLFGDLLAARHRAELALTLFRASEDHKSLGDVYWLLASIAQDSGARAERDECLGRAMIEYDLSGDQTRQDNCFARQQLYTAFVDPDAAMKALVTRFGAAASTDPVPKNAWAESVWALLAHLAGEIGKSAQHSIRCFDAARLDGQHRLAAMSAINAGESFAKMNNFDAALEWGRRAIDLARTKEWPLVMATCLSEAGNTLRKFGRFDQAHRLLKESVEIMDRFEGSQYSAITWMNLGTVLMELGRESEAITWLHKSEIRARELKINDTLNGTLVSSAKVLMALGQLQAALSKVNEALTTARQIGNKEWQVAALRVLASIHRRTDINHGLPASLACLEEAVQIANDIAGYTIPAELLEELAAAFADSGHTAKAYELALQAGKAREKTNDKAATDRATAMQVLHDTERVRADAEHHRQMSLLQAERAETLRKANETLEKLGEVGCQITSKTSAAEVFQALYLHINAFLDMAGLMIYQLSPDKLNLQMTFGVEVDFGANPNTIPIDHPNSPIAVTARLLKEQVIEQTAETPITDPNIQTMACVPLRVGQQVLGVLAIQSRRANAYLSRECAILRTLAAYGGIALANAEALEALQIAKTQLRRKNDELELLATTDRLTGLCNRYELDRVLEREFAAAVRYGTVFSIIIADIDHFKRVNDTFGHYAGDQVLIAFGQILSQRLRRSDVVGRWGGEEFMLVCAHTNIDGAKTLAELIRCQIDETAFPVVGRLSASFGVAGFQQGDSITSIATRADAALYRAKEAGRNRVVLG